MRPLPGLGAIINMVELKVAWMMTPTLLRVYHSPRHGNLLFKPVFKAH